MTVQSSWSEGERLLHGRPIEPMKEWDAYGPRKAECDRVCIAAAEDGTNAMIVRPTFVFGPHDYTERRDYWIDRMANYDQVLVPGDGDNLVHHVYVKDVASALRTVAERGTPGEAYNVGAHQLLTLDQRLELIAKALGDQVELIHASERELARYDMTPTDFPLVRSEPSLVATGKLASLGWDSMPHGEAVPATVEEHLANDRTGRHHGPDRESERDAINSLTT